MTPTPHAPKKRKKGIWIFLLLCLAALGGFFYMRSHQNETPPSNGTENAQSLAPFSFQVRANEYTTIAKEDAVLTVSGHAILEPLRTYTIASRVSGEIVQLPIEQGQYVQSSDIVAEISTDYLRLTYENQQAQLDQIDAQLTQAQTQAERSRELRARNAGSSAQEENDANALLVLQAQKRAQEAVIAATQLDIDNSLIRPIHEGLVTDVAVSIGDNVAPGTLLASIVDTKSLILNIDISPEHASLVTVGQSATVALTSDEVKHDAIVEQITPIASTQNRRIPVRVRVPNTDGQLFVGVGAIAELAIAHFPDSIVLPRAGLRTDEQGVHVLGVVDQKAVRIDITIDPEWDTLNTMRVLDGLNEGDVVLTAPLEQIKPGDLLEMDS